jgi:hypothetical protein
MKLLFLAMALSAAPLQRTLVLPFEDQAGKDAKTGGGLALLLSAELSQYPEIALLEREELRKAVDEQSLTQDAAAMGKTWGARWIVRGSFR